MVDDENEDILSMNNEPNFLDDGIDMDDMDEEDLAFEDSENFGFSLDSTRGFEE